MMMCSSSIHSFIYLFLFIIHVSLSQIMKLHSFNIINPGGEEEEEEEFYYHETKKQEERRRRKET